MPESGKAYAFCIGFVCEDYAMFHFFHKDKEDDSSGDQSESRVFSFSSQLPRLLQQRIASAEECACKRCGDLLDNLHKKTKLLENHHMREMPALIYWTQSHKDASSPHFECQLDNKMKLSPADLTHPDEFIDSLIEVEHSWQRSQSNACFSEDNDRFWMSHYLKLKEAVEAQRNLENESLAELRESALANDEPNEH